MRFVMLSDTHGEGVDIPEGDVLIYAGDWSPGRGDLEDTHKFAQWIGDQPHTHILVIPGNHDFAADKYPDTSTVAPLFMTTVKNDRRLIRLDRSIGTCCRLTAIRPRIASTLNYARFMPDSRYKVFQWLSTLPAAGGLQELGKRRTRMRA